VRLTLALVLVCALWPAAVHADDMDVTLSRFRIATRNSDGSAVADLPPGCSGTGENGLPRAYCPDADSWRRLTSQLGASLIPPVLAPARTVGYGGTQVAIEGWITGIDAREYWRVGTEGDESAGAEGRNRFPDSTLIWSRVAIRKGFPFGFQLGTSFGHLFNTQMWAWGLEIQWALFEGYRTGIGVLPDIAVRGMVHTMTGDAEFNLTVPSVDVVISKPITIAGTGTITPFVSGLISWIFADSELVDLTPDIDAFAECQPSPTSTMTSCTRDATRDPPIADGRMPGEDYNNNATFPQLRATRMRLALGVQGRYEALTLTGSFQFDLSKPGNCRPYNADPDLYDDPDNVCDERTDVPADLPRQWTVAFGAGLQF